MKKITLLFLFMIGSISTSFGQLTQDFEGTWPPTGWTIETTNAGFTWEEADPGINGKCAFVGWDDVDPSDESLISPVFTVPAGSPFLEFSLVMGYSFSIDPDDNYDFIISISTNGGTTWTPIWNETDADPFDDYDELDITVPLTAYAGSTNAKLKFQYVGFNGDILAIDDVVVDVPPATAPDCVTLNLPADAATDVEYWNPVELSWTAATTGTTVESYDIYIDTNATPTTLLENQTETTIEIEGLSPSTTYYWTVVAKNAAGDATGCTVFSFTTASNPFAPYCGPLSFTNNTEPITLVNFSNINNVTSGTLNGTPDHEDFRNITGNVIAGNDYTITLKGNTDGNYTNRFMVYADWNQDGDFDDDEEAYTIAQTITNTNGTDATQATQSLSVPATATIGTTRMRVKKIFGTDDYEDPCLGTAFGQVEEYTLAVTAPTTDSPDYVALQWPPTATITIGGSVTVYGQVYEAGLTDVAPNIVGQAPGITAWVGYSTTNTNPNTWTNWVPATWNSAHNNDNNDEYQANIGANLAPGTYYYATRFQLISGPYAYGGINPSDNNSGNFWNGTTYISGVLTVNGLPNDECGGAIALIPGGIITDNDIDGDSTGATLSSNTPGPSCGNFNFATVGKDVWYKVVVPASGNLTIETSTNASGNAIDTIISVYSGSCGALVAVNCDDDGAAETAIGLSKLVLIGQTPGATLLIRLFGYNGLQGPYSISAYDASLGNNSFDSSNFRYYPNPIKNNLNLSYNKEISNVEVFNLLGQKVISNVINANEAQIDMSNLTEGAYMVKVTSDNQVKTIKVIKE